MKLRKKLSTLLLTILIIQTTLVASAANIEFVTQELTEEELIEYDKKLEQKKIKEIQEEIDDEEKFLGSNQSDEHIANNNLGANPGETLDGYKVAAKMEISKISLNEHVLDSFSTDALKKGVCIQKTTSGINKAGNTVIIGKNDDDSSSFEKLDQLENNDEIKITDTKEIVTYEVYKCEKTELDDESSYDRETNGATEITLACDNREEAERVVVCAKEKSRKTIQEPSGTDWTDFSKAKVEYLYNGTTLTARLSGITAKESHSYSLYVGTDKEKLSVENKETMLGFSKVKDKDYYQTTIPNKLMALNQKYYGIVVEKHSTETKVQTTASEILEGNYPADGSRIDIFMHTEGTCSIYQKVYNDSSYTRNLSYKLGKVTDIEILKTFKTNETEGFKKLYTFAQNDKGLSKGTITNITGAQTKNPAQSLTLEKGSYYYIYLTLDDENGKYRPLSDAQIYEPAGKCLVHFAYSSINVGGSGSSSGGGTTGGGTSTKDPTAAKGSYPFTGKIAIGTAVVGLIATTYILYRKNKNLDDVK